LFFSIAGCRLAAKKREGIFAALPQMNTLFLYGSVWVGVFLSLTPSPIGRAAHEQQAIFDCFLSVLGFFVP